MGNVAQSMPQLRRVWLGTRKSSPFLSVCDRWFQISVRLGCEWWTDVHSPPSHSCVVCVSQHRAPLWVCVLRKRFGKFATLWSTFIPSGFCFPLTGMLAKLLLKQTNTQTRKNDHKLDMLRFYCCHVIPCGVSNHEAIASLPKPELKPSNHYNLGINPEDNDPSEQIHNHLIKHDILAINSAIGKQTGLNCAPCVWRCWWASRKYHKGLWG